MVTATGAGPDPAGNRGYGRRPWASASDRSRSGPSGERDGRPSSLDDDRSREVLESVFRHERSQILAVLIRLTGDFAVAEDALQGELVTIWNELPRLRDPDLVLCTHRPGAEPGFRVRGAKEAVRNAGMLLGGPGLH